MNDDRDASLKPFLLAVLALLVVPAAGPARADTLSPDQERRIKLGVDLIKLGCGTGVSQRNVQVGGTVDASLTLKKAPGVSAGGQITYSTEEAQGLAALLDKELTDNATALSEAQLDCMKPYVQKIFAVIFPEPPAAPAIPAASAAPVSMVVVQNETVPLDGYAFTAPPLLPATLEPGPVLPGGGRTRIVFQATDPTAVVQIDRVSLQITRSDLVASLAFNYGVDPLRQSGFGAARPRQFTARLKDTGQGEVSYITDHNKAVAVPLSNILPRQEFAILELDTHSGLQEAIDVNLVPTHAGFYEVRFRAYATSHGQEYALVGKPIYIVRH